jgi:malate permease and related proteins
MPYQLLLPVFVFFIIGALLRSFGLASRDQGAFLFRIVLYVTLPALVFLAIANAELTGRAILLPVCAFMINVVCTIGAMIYARALKLENRQAGAVVLGAGITNMLFVFPFVLATLGQAALAEAILFDLGNAVFVATVAYSLALYFGERSAGTVTAFLFKTLRSPIFLAVSLAIIVNISDWPVPETVVDILSPLGRATIPLVLIAIGVSFSAAGLFDRLPVVTLLLRMPLGLLIGALLTWAFGFESLMATVIVVSAAAPIGFSSVTLASIADLDTEQAASALSVSVAVGMISTTALLLVTARLWGP